MDTSIIVVIAIIVVFAVAVPTMIRKAATELSRVEIDTVPHEAQVIAADPQNPCRDHTARAKVFHSGGAVEPSVPRPDVAPMTSSPTLKLSAPVPEFSVIDGQADDTSTTAEVDAESQLSALPVAVGETRSAFIDDAARSQDALALGASTPGNVRMLHPAVHAVFNQTHQGPTNSGSSDSGDPGRATSDRGGFGAGVSRAGSGHLGEGSMRATGRQGTQGAGPRSGPTRGTDPQQTSSTTNTHRRGTQIPDPNFGADEDHSMTEKATTLRESMRSLGTMVRGFALLFLGSVLGILVTGVLAMFSVVHIALTGVFLGLAVVSLLIVRTLNLRKREIKSRLRELEARPKKKPSAGTPKATTSKTAAATMTTGKASTTRTATANRDAAAQKSAGSTKAAAGSTKAAQARAAMQRSATAKLSREEADTGEIPIVRIRNEAAEGHTTRQVLLTGPIPIVEEESTKDSTAGEAPGVAESSTTAQAPAWTEITTLAKAAAPKEATTPVGTTASAETARRTEAKSESTAKDDAALDAALDSEATNEASNEDDAEVRAALDAAAPSVNDPFMQRLKARDAWSPTPLPVPSYVDAPQVEHPVPEATAADASSYETEARSREDIAAQFAAELGYRPELSDSAREEGPLEHGRKAIRTTKAADLGAVNDVLARRRA